LTTRPRPRDTHRPRFKWQSGINRRSFHHIPGKPDTPRTPFAVCSTTILLHRADTFFIFTRRSLPLSPSIFTVLFAMLLRCFFRFFAVRQIRRRLRCFRVPAFFFCPVLTNPRKQPVVTNRSRLQVTNVSGPIDVGSLLFRDRSSRLSVVKFDGKQRLHDDRKWYSREHFFIITTLLGHFLRNWRYRITI